MDQTAVRCPRCQALLFKGVLFGTIRCRRCSLNVKFPERDVAKAEAVAQVKASS